jgi:hypothetical protein
MSETQQQQRVFFRFEFTEEFKTKLENFAREHENKDRKTYKKEWESWCKIHETDIKDENHRLVELGFTGDVYDKMFMSVRYYFRKKIQKVDNCSQPEPEPETKKRRKYSYLDKNMFEIIQNYIESLQETLSPSKAFTLFIENNKEPILSNMNDTETTNREHIKTHVDKIKKTFKNLYYKKFAI